MERERSTAQSSPFPAIALSSVVVTLVQRKTGKDGRPNWLDNNINAGRLDYFYYLLAGMGAANLLYFLVCAHYYRYKDSSGSTVAPRGAGDQRRPLRQGHQPSPQNCAQTAAGERELGYIRSGDQPRGQVHW